MKTLATAAAALSLLLAPLAEASPKNGRGNGNGNGNENGNGAWANGSHCPPGLADREPRCEPPGQARRGGVEVRQEDSDDRNDLDDASDWVEDVIEVAENDGRDSKQALAIVGGLIGLALIERARREAQPEVAAVAPAPVAPAPFAPAPSLFSFSEVPSRPASLATLATAPFVGDPAYADALDPGFLAEAGNAGFVTDSPLDGGPVADPEPVVAPSTRLVPLGPLPAPVPTPQEEAQLTDVFRRAAGTGDTGF